MGTDPLCHVERCRFPATALHRLKERDGAFDYPTEVVICELHREQLSNPATEWVLLNEPEGRRLLVGPMLAEMNEYILLEPISELIGHMASRNMSHRDHNGFHLPLRVRRRGGDPETMTLVVPFDVLAQSVDFLSAVVPSPESDRVNGDAE